MDAEVKYIVEDFGVNKDIRKYILSVFLMVYVVEWKRTKE